MFHDMFALYRVCFVGVDGSRLRGSQPFLPVDTCIAEEKEGLPAFSRTLCLTKLNMVRAINSKRAAAEEDNSGAGWPLIQEGVVDRTTQVTQLQRPGQATAKPWKEIPASARRIRPLSMEYRESDCHGL
jgi:hypothetical protein